MDQEGYYQVVHQYGHHHCGGRWKSCDLYYISIMYTLVFVSLSSRDISCIHIVPTPPTPPPQTPARQHQLNQNNYYVSPPFHNPLQLPPLVQPPIFSLWHWSFPLCIQGGTISTALTVYHFFFSTWLFLPEYISHEWINQSGLHTVCYRVCDSGWSAHSLNEHMLKRNIFTA